MSSPSSLSLPPCPHPPPVPTPPPAAASIALPPLSHVAWRKKLVVVLVGLPARGNSYVATKIVNWLRWRGSKSESFNQGKLRRARAAAAAAAAEAAGGSTDQPTHTDAVGAADVLHPSPDPTSLSYEVLDTMLLWLRSGGDLAVLDAPHTTRSQRQQVLKRIEQVSPVLPVCFIESICTDSKMLLQNYIAKVTYSPDYAGMPLEEALEHLKAHVASYEESYEPIDEGNVREDVSYIKLMNLASKVVCNRIHGTLMHSINSFLMSIHVKPRPIYLTRAGRCVGAADESKPLQQVAVAAAASSTPGDTSNTTVAAASHTIGSTQLAPHPVLIKYSQSEAADLDETGQKYGALMNDFVAAQVLEYWHKHLVSRRDENPNAINNANNTNSHTCTCDPNEPDLSPNDVAGATVFSPPVSLPSSPQIGPSRGGVPPPPTNDTNSIDQGELGTSAAASSSSSTRILSSSSASPMTIHARCIAGDGTDLPERSTAIIGSGSMLLTLERSKTNDTLPVVVYTSTLPRALQTVSTLTPRALYIQQQSSLNTLDYGTLTGKTFEEIRDTFPELHASWLKQPYTYRFPGGESQQDKARALDSFMMELERQLFPVLIVSHASTLQILLGYFSNLPCESYSSIAIPQHVLIELVPTQYGWSETFYDFSALESEPVVLPITNSIFSHKQNFYSS